MKNPEKQYIRSLDRKERTEEELKEQGDISEEAISEVLPLLLPQLEFRWSTREEDAGKTAGFNGKSADFIGYMNSKPAVVIQATSARNKYIREDKRELMRNEPFVRLPEMNRTDTAIPRIVIYADPEESGKFIQDHDISQHPQLIQEIVKSAISSLSYCALVTKNQKEIAQCQQLISLFPK